MATSLLPPVQDCHGFVAAEGRYELQQDIFLEDVLPHSVIPTYVSSVSVKYKDYLNSSGNGNGAGGPTDHQNKVWSATNFERLDEQLKDLKVSDERTADDGDDTHSNSNNSTILAGNFHGNLVDLPLYNDESLGYKSPRTSVLMPPGPPQAVTSGPPPPLKDSTASSRLSESAPGSQPHAVSSRGIGRATSFSHHTTSTQLQEEGGGAAGAVISGQALSYTAAGPSSGSSAGFTSFFTGKRKKPKSNIAKTNSTFVAKIVVNENLAKILANRANEDVYVFWNIGRTFVWSSLGQKPNDPLSRLLFTRAFPTAHDVNVLTRSYDHLDVIIGFSTGDIIWFNPLSNKYSRLNKQAVIKDSAVTMIKWMPGSEDQFMVSFQDGTLVVMNKDRDDSAFTPSTPPHENSFYPTKPKHGKHNPISHWNIGKKSVTGFSFSPDLQHVAVVSLDGELRIIDFQHERLIESFQSYFGALNCVCWSPDGKYILTGGQDDLVTIWSFKDLRIIARCQGHQSYVTGVAFDSWRCDERNYRFGSVGEDAKLLLWDFSVGALHKPKAASTQRRGSNGTVTGAGGAFKPGHGSKASITSLRGLGGHSLFSGHNKSSLSQQVMIPNSIGQSEDTAHDTSKESSEAPSVASSSTRIHDSIATQDTRPSASHNSENSSVVAETASLLSTLGSEAVDGVSQEQQTSTSSSEATTTSNSTHTAEEKVHKRQTVQQARGLPHLQIHQPHIYENNGGKYSGEHGSHHGLGLSSMFHLHRHQNQQQQQRDADAQEEPLVRPPEPRARVAMLQPLMIAVIHQEPLASIAFREDAVITSDRRGHVKVWKRPSVAPVCP